MNTTDALPLSSKASASDLEIAAAAAALIVEEGMEYGPAKLKALKQLGLSPRTSLPPNNLVHEQVMDYLYLYCADTQPAELAALRELALCWMRRLEQMQPDCRIYLEGAVWLGSATRLSDIRLVAFSPEPKSFEIGMLNLGLDIEVAPIQGKDSSSHLYFNVKSHQLSEFVGVHVKVHDLDDERGVRKQTMQDLPAFGDLRSLEDKLNAVSSSLNTKKG